MHQRVGHAEQHRKRAAASVTLSKFGCNVHVHRVRQLGMRAWPCAWRTIGPCMHAGELHALLGIAGVRRTLVMIHMLSHGCRARLNAPSLISHIALSARTCTNSRCVAHANFSLQVRIAAIVDMQVRIAAIVDIQFASVKAGARSRCTAIPSESFIPKDAERQAWPMRTAHDWAMQCRNCNCAQTARR